MLGLETALALALTELDLDHRTTSWQLMSWRPAAIGAEWGTATVDGTISDGAPANLVCHRHRHAPVDGRSFRPRHGVASEQHSHMPVAALKGRVRHTIRRRRSSGDRTGRPSDESVEISRRSPSGPRRR